MNKLQTYCPSCQAEVWSGDAKPGRGMEHLVYVRKTGELDFNKAQTEGYECCRHCGHEYYYRLKLVVTCEVASLEFKDNSKVTV